jgi:hypothetical protein
MHMADGGGSRGEHDAALAPNWSSASDRAPEGCLGVLSAGCGRRNGMTAQAGMTMTLTAGGDPPCPARPVPWEVAPDERRLATAPS